MRINKKGMVFFMAAIVIMAMVAISTVYVNFSAKLYKEHNYLASDLMEGSYKGIIELNNALLYVDYSGRYAFQESLVDFQDFVDCKSPTGLILVDENCDLRIEEAFIESFDRHFNIFLTDLPYNVRNFDYSFANGKFIVLGLDEYEYKKDDFIIMNKPYLEILLSFDFNLVNEKYSELVQVKIDCENNVTCVYENLPSELTIDNPNIVYSTKINGANVDFLFNI